MNKSQKPASYAAIVPDFPQILHGGDYNPDQWRHDPKILEEDVRLMKLSGVNVVSLGIFAWSAIEPTEGNFTFGWMDDVFEKLHAAGVRVVLATPSGARPAWMDKKYPEVLRVREDRLPNLHGQRHNHCYTSPEYRRMCTIMNRKLAERYGKHPAIMMWHVSNEYGGDCHCDLCQEAFREWLKKRYKNDLNALNLAWWADFWAHRFSDWSEIESPSSRGEPLLHGMNLDWKRFVTYQTVDFYKAEIAPLRQLTPGLPITVNMMGTYPGLDYRVFAPEIDVVSWDNYPTWHTDVATTADIGAYISFVHDLNRSLKDGKPFMLMESTPSLVNWQPTNKLKRPGMHKLSSLQAVAHGSDTVMYFQWRKSRGSSEKFHGAVVDHLGTEHNRVFREVAELGQVLKKLGVVTGSTTRPQVAVVYDWETRWALEDLQGLSQKRNYQQTVMEHYQAFWRRGISVDVVAPEADFSAYDMVVAPMLHMLRPGVGESLTAFVKDGGTLVTTYLTGMVNESDLCFLGGFPGPLRKVTGIWAEEVDSYFPSDRNTLLADPSSSLGLSGSYGIKDFCEIIHAEGSEVLARYGSDFYAGMPVLTRNRFGKGNAYHVAARTGTDFLFDFYDKLTVEHGIGSNVSGVIPEGVTVQKRANGKREYLFVMNFSESVQRVALKIKEGTDLASGQILGPDTVLELGVYGVAVVETKPS